MRDSKGQSASPPDSQSGEDIGAQRDRVMDALQVYSTDHAEFGRRFAASMALHSTDGAALLEIAAAEQRGDPLTPSRLASRVLLSSGATASLINRLEGAGHVERSRVHADRRVITLRTTTHVTAAADMFFAPLQVELDALIAGLSPAALTTIEAFLHDLHAAMSSVLGREQ